MLAVNFETGCSPEEMTIATVEMPSIKPDHIIIKVMATAVNRADTLQRKGQYPVPPGESNVLGLEAAGTIFSGGGSCSDRRDERVMALLSGGGNAQYVLAQKDHIMSIPEGMSFEEAAAIPEAWLTAFQLLDRITCTKSHDTVLIHAGASGVGTAAIQLARQVFNAATVIATVGSAEKQRFVHDLGAHHAINYKTEDFCLKCKEITNGRGVDVVLDCVGGSYWAKNADVLALDGRWALYGLMGGKSVNGELFTTLLRKRIRLQGTNLRSRPNQYKIGRAHV